MLKISECGKLGAAVVHTFDRNESAAQGIAHKRIWCSTVSTNTERERKHLPGKCGLCGVQYGWRVLEVAISDGQS